LVISARKVIDRNLAANFDPNREEEYSSRSYCPEITASADIMNLFVRSPIYGIVDELLGIENIGWSEGQIAIRKAHNHHEPIPPEPHIDGFAEGVNGVTPGNIYNHTALVGVFLTPVRTEFSGNLTVWPSSHGTYERYFQDRGPRAMTEPMPKLAPGQGIQMMCEPGDVVLAHYQVGHAAAVNMSDLDRIAVYFRIVLRAVELDRWHYLTNIWDGWKLDKTA
jgi:ectoine hydroxylase-related dioxygenase (phytanoyl-CoA dioxygenase family)